jgi:8-oxo-dGTP pyrophosphatase MutT (NUDIX family)
MKDAVCCLIEQGGKFLAVTRKDDPTKWGLPGGKVDPGETRLEAVVREVFEETGLVLRSLFLSQTYKDVCPGEVFYSVTGYSYLWKSDFSKMIPESGLLLSWKTADELSDPEISPFAEYNKKMFASLTTEQISLVYN